MYREVVQLVVSSLHELEIKIYTLMTVKPLSFPVQAKCELYREHRPCWLAACLITLIILYSPFLILYSFQIIHYLHKPPTYIKK